MPIDVQISFRGMEPSPAAEAQVQKRAEELEQFSDRISICRVMLEAAHRHHRQGRIYHVRVDLAVPGGRIVANRDSGEDHAHEDLHVAIRDAFDAARRRLQDHMRRLDGRTKQHEAPSIGHIVSLFAERDYGFLATESGEEIYLHRNSVLGSGFDTLKVGDRVRYVVDPEEGEKGAQASTVVPIDADS
jgi:cold shock CspA family protein/ribosome-associated translation inhibitor RaiA